MDALHLDPERCCRALASRDAVAPVTLWLPYRGPLDVDHLWWWLEAHALPGVETVEGGAFRRVLRLAHGSGTVELTPAEGRIRCVLRLDDLRDLDAAGARVRRLLDLDADSRAIDEVLATDPALRPLVRRLPGLRAPGSVDPEETAIRAVLGQQVSLAAGCALGGRLVHLVDDRVERVGGDLTHRFPSPAAIAEADLDRVGMPASRIRTLRALATALASKAIDLRPAADRAEVRAALLGLPGVGPWTADYILMRALGDPDVLLATDVALRRGAAAVGLPDDPAELDRAGERWRPWRTYATHLLWAAS